MQVAVGPVFISIYITYFLFKHISTAASRSKLRVTIGSGMPFKNLKTYHLLMWWKPLNSPSQVVSLLHVFASLPAYYTRTCMRLIPMWPPTFVPASVNVIFLG